MSSIRSSATFDWDKAAAEKGQLFDLYFKYFQAQLSAAHPVMENTRASPGGMIPARWARDSAGAGHATIWGHGFKTSAHDGTTAHSLDYDNVTLGTDRPHPSVSLVPETFALGELLGATGREVLRCM